MPVPSCDEVLLTPVVVTFSKSNEATALGGETDGGSKSGAPLGKIREKRTVAGTNIILNNVASGHRAIRREKTMLSVMK